MARTVDRYKHAHWLNYLRWTPEEQKALYDYAQEQTADHVLYQLVEQRGFTLVLDYKDAQYWARWYAPQDTIMPFQRRISVATTGFPFFNSARIALILVLSIQDDRAAMSVATKPRYWREKDQWLR